MGINYDTIKKVFYAIVNGVYFENEDELTLIRMILDYLDTIQKNKELMELYEKLTEREKELKKEREKEYTYCR